MKTGGTVHEIYSAIQGEGLRVGERHVFFRLAGCNLDCCYCDTRARERTAETCTVERTAGTGDFEKHPNPLDWKEAVRRVRELAGGGVPAAGVSFTGGEPLVQVDFVGVVASGLRAEGLHTYLETNGTLPDSLTRVCDSFDCIVMDMKLPSSTGGEVFWEQHRDFLNIARRGAVFAKAVVTAETREEDVARAAQVIAEVDDGVPLVLQPVTPARMVRSRVDLGRLRMLESIAKTILSDVRVIPQVQHVLGER